MRYTGIQPQYFPRLHYMARILNADIFMIRDDAQYVRKHRFPDGKNNISYQAQTPIKQATGIQLLSVPVQHDGFQAIADTNISLEKPWREDQLKSIQMAYSKSANFSTLFPELIDLISFPHTSLADLNIKTIIWALGHLLEESPMIKERVIIEFIENQLKNQKLFRLKHIALGSQTKTSKNNDIKRNEKIIALMKEVGANEDYCGGTALSAYMDTKLFEENNIKITIQDWQCNEYSQLFMKQQGFLPNLSILDLLMNASPKHAVEIIKG